MATKHFICDYDIVKNEKVVKSGTMQFARVNVSEEEDTGESFDAVRREYENGGVRLKQNTFREVAVAGPVKTEAVKDAKGNTVERIVERPPVVIANVS